MQVVFVLRKFQMAMLLFRLAHQFELFLVALRYPIVPSHTLKTDPRDISDLDWWPNQSPRS